jgi:hypothetical protein
LKKSELENHRDQYDAFMLKANQAFAEGLCRYGLSLACAALRYADGMMQYAVKYNSAIFSNVTAIEAVLKFAPLLLDMDTLILLQTILRDQRRIKRTMSEDIDQLITDAQLKLEECYRFWSLLESGGSIQQEYLSKLLSGEQQSWIAIAESWEHMGLIRRVADGHSFHISLVTKFDEEIQAKCGKCGSISRGMKKNFYTASTCQNCKISSVLVLVFA